MLNASFRSVDVGGRRFDECIEQRVVIREAFGADMALHVGQIEDRLRRRDKREAHERRASFKSTFGYAASADEGEAFNTCIPRSSKRRA